MVPNGIVHKSQDAYDLLTVLIDNRTPYVVTPIPAGVSSVVSLVPYVGPYASTVINVINTLGADTRIKHNYETFTFNMLTGAPIVGYPPCHYEDGQSDLPVRHVVGNGHFGSERIVDSCPRYREGPPAVQGFPNQHYSYGTRRWLIDLDGDGVQDTLYCAEDPVQGFDFGPMHLDYKLARAAETHDPQPPNVETHAARDGEIPLHGQLCNPKAKQQFSIGFDVDGDGTGNLLALDAHAGWAALMPVDSGTDLEFEWRMDVTDGLTLEASEHYYVSAIDVNGDGLRDLLGLPVQEAFNTGLIDLMTPVVAYNTGRGFREEALTPTRDGIPGQGGNFPAYGAHVLDIDQDGIEELVYPSTEARGVVAPWRVGRVRDGQYRNEAIPSLPAGFGVLGDFDGDGDIDAFTQAVVYTTVCGLGSPVQGCTPVAQEFRFHPGKGRRQNLLETVTDGLGHRVVVAYGATNAEGEVYNKWPSSVDGSCAWPLRCVARVDQALVSEHVEMHFKNQARTMPAVDRLYAYNYRGARMDTAGYGWLGFSEREITVHDAVGGFLGSTRIEYEAPEVWSVEESEVPYMYLKAGLPKFREEVSPEVDSDISISDNHRVEVQRVFEWTQRTSASGRPFMFLSRTQVDTYERLWDFGITGMIPVTQEVGTTDVDDYGNATDETTTRQDYEGVPPTASLDETSITVAQVTTTFDPTQAEIEDWLIALPKSRTESSDPRCDSPTIGCPEKHRERTSTFTYHPDTDLLQTVTREPNHPTLELTTVITRDDRGNVTQVVATDAVGDVRETTTTYDDRRLFPTAMTVVGDGDSLTTEVTFDNRFGTLTSRADPNGIDETWSYDVNGVMRQHVGPNGVTTTDYFTSDYEILPDGFEILASSRIVVSKQGGASSEQRLNSFGQIVSRTTFGFQGTPVLEEFEYDRRQRLLRQRRPHVSGDASQGEVHLGYDEMDRLVSVEYPDGNDVLYDHSLTSSLDTAAAGPKVAGGYYYTRTTDQRENTTVQAVDRDGQPVGVTDALGKLNTYKYAAFGYLEAIVDPANRSIGFVHDEYGRRTAVTDAARGGTQITSYNGFGQITGSLDAAGRSADYHYDGFGRLESLDDNDGATTWIYGATGENEIGRLVETTSAFGQRRIFGYEPRGSSRNRGLPVSVTDELYAIDPPSAEARELVTQYHYDDNSRLEQVDYPASGGAPVSVNYDFDTYGHTIKAFNPASPSQVYWELIAADDQGYRIGQERLGTHACGGGQGTTTTRTYHAFTGLPDTIQTQCGSTVLQDLTYTYDPAGNLQGRKTGALQESFGHDALNRLTHYSAGGAPQVQKYFYDEEGRGRMISQDGVGAYSYQAQGRDWIHLAGPYTYGQDLVGNVVSRSGPDVPGGTQEITYTAFDLPSQISSSAGQVDFSYDSSGTRVVKQSSSTTTFYAGSFYQRSEGASSTDHRFMVFAGGRPVAQLNATAQGGSTSAPTVKYLHDDMLGSVNVVSNNTGAVSTTRAYSPFGKNFSPHTETPYGFTGHESDDELGLVNMRGRMYDPALGQFLSADPIIQQPYSQGLNRFAYVNNSPLNAVDPSGFAACPNRPGRGCSAEIGPSLRQFGTVAGVVGGVAGIAAVSQLGAGPQAIPSGVGASAVGSSPGSAGVPNPSAAQAGVGPGQPTSALGSLALDASLHAPQKTTSSDAEAPRSGGGRTGGAPGRGAVAPDAITPTQEPAPTQPSTVGNGSCPGACRKGDPKGGPGSHLKFDPEEYAYRLSDSARKHLKPIFDHFDFDLGRISISFGPTNGNSAFTVGDSIIINREVWERSTPTQRIGLLGHEITHSVQYDAYSVWTDFWARYFPEWGQGDSNYIVPDKLGEIGLDKLNPLDHRFTLDQIAEHVRTKAIQGLPP